MEFVGKNLEALKKLTMRGGQSLEMKKLKEEQATVEAVLAWLESGKDVRKNNWGTKEVRNSPTISSFFFFFFSFPLGSWRLRPSFK